MALVVSAAPAEIPSGDKGLHRETRANALAIPSILAFLIYSFVTEAEIALDSNTLPPGIVGARGGEYEYESSR